MWVGDYPPDVKEAFGEMSAKAKAYRPLIAALFFGSIITITVLSLGRLRLITPEVGFWSYALSTFIVLMVFNIFDLLIIDWLIFVAIQPKAIILPGTEGLGGYKDYCFHFRGFIIGTAFSGVGALVISAVEWAVVVLFC